jgi:hypothetical protein
MQWRSQCPSLAQLHHFCIAVVRKPMQAGH